MGILAWPDAQQALVAAQFAHHARVQLVRALLTQFPQAGIIRRRIRFLKFLQFEELLGCQDPEPLAVFEVGRPAVPAVVPSAPAADQLVAQPLRAPSVALKQPQQRLGEALGGQRGNGDKEQASDDNEPLG
jgi:hypothetical protein